MYWRKQMSHEDKANVLNWAAMTGVIMTVLGWALIGLSEDGETPIVTTSFIIVSLSIILSDKQYDEFQRGLAYAGAVGGMLAVTLWTAFIPIIADMADRFEFSMWEATSDKRFTFYIAASGFYIGYLFNRKRGKA
ncbi:hypothetical protein CD351_09805 [Erythrobacter sp. KY5]|uniref:hypothetical protein n=1 Tax=Erythrobacter sp. KY5 TaxID=2011159 RepID=UPI000DBF2AD1|nr:hypothetical protein [Erythrobacter sp. KY5]AWW74716.1 hypothetical protein CD351_09805 [Erythrobacter sp. KY5]